MKSGIVKRRFEIAAPRFGGIRTAHVAREALPPDGRALSADGRPVVFAHACKFGREGIVSKRRGSRYARGRSSNWLKVKDPDAPAVRRERVEEWGG
jgi:hypothetical protein